MESVAADTALDGYHCQKCEFKCVNESSRGKHEKEFKTHAMVKTRLRVLNADVKRITSRNLVVVPDRREAPAAATAALNVFNAAPTKSKPEKDDHDGSDAVRGDEENVTWGVSGALAGLLTDLGWSELLEGSKRWDLLHSFLIVAPDKDVKEWPFGKQFEAWWSKVWPKLKTVPAELKWLATADGNRNTSTLWKAPETDLVLSRRASKLGMPVFLQSVLDVKIHSLIS